MSKTANSFTFLQRTNRKRGTECDWIFQKPRQLSQLYYQSQQQPSRMQQFPHHHLSLLRHQQQKQQSPPILSKSSVAYFSRNKGGTNLPKWLLNVLESSSRDSDTTTTTNNNDTGTATATATTTSMMTEEVDPGIIEGTDLRILKYPHSSLRATNALVTTDELQNGSIAKIAREMFLIMYAAQGVGLAAPQVGVNKRFMIYNESGDRSKWLNEVTLINPIITEYSDTTDIEIEGCLSFPNMNGSVSRSKWIKVEAMNLKGKTIKKKYKGWEARIFQHEYDHLDGIVYIDRLIDDENKQTLVTPRLAQLIQDHDVNTYGEPAL
jgi:peptide deformylase